MRDWVNISPKSDIQQTWGNCKSFKMEGFHAKNSPLHNLLYFLRITHEKLKSLEGNTEIFPYIIKEACHIVRLKPFQF